MTNGGQRQVEKIYYTVQETAAILGISPRTIYNSIGRGSVRKFIKPRWFGSKPLFHKEDIQAYADGLPAENESRRGRKMAEAVV
jgi:excisionase family DNA binding protein